MKIRIADRILVALAGLVLLAMPVTLVLDMYFGFALWDGVQAFIEANTMAGHLVTWVAVRVVILLAALLGLYCVGMMFRHQKRSRRGFVLQQTDCGELSIAVKAIEGLVQKCVERHEEISVMSTSLDSGRDGLIIKLRIGLEGGVNIPLAVSALQKQIKQYVTSCSGVDVKEVKVQVETSAAKSKHSRFTVEKLPEKSAPLPVVEDKTPAITAASVEAEQQAEKKRPLHQRIFGSAEEPVTVAAPPVPVEEPKAEAVVVDEPGDTLPEEPEEPAVAPAEEAPGESQAEEAQEAVTGDESVPPAEAEEAAEEVKHEDE